MATGNFSEAQGGRRSVCGDWRVGCGAGRKVREGGCVCVQITDSLPIQQKLTPHSSYIPIKQY